jgi:hypothetical protein
MQVDISAESFMFLKNLISEIESQDNAATASPYFYVIQEPVERIMAEGCGDEVKYLIEEERELDLLTEKEVLKHFKKQGEHRNKDIDDLEGSGIITKYEVKTEYEDIDSHNVFFTRKAYNAHIKRNGHNLNRPRPYIRHAYRNYELEDLFKAIKEIVQINT